MIIFFLLTNFWIVQAVSEDVLLCKIISLYDVLSPKTLLMSLFTLLFSTTCDLYLFITFHLIIRFSSNLFCLKPLSNKSLRNIYFPCKTRLEIFTCPIREFTVLKTAFGTPILLNTGCICVCVCSTVWIRGLLFCTGLSFAYKWRFNV